MNKTNVTEWRNFKLSELVNNENDIIAGPFGSNLKVSDYIDNGVPIIRLQNIERNRFIEKDIKYISEDKAKELSYHSYNSGDILLAKLGDPIGKTCIVPDHFKPGIVVADVVRIRPSKNFNKIYLAYYLNSKHCIRQFQMGEIGTTRPRVNLSQIRNLKVKLSSIAEQTAIANILSSVDEAIQKADEVIKQTERIKQAILQKLLTAGMGHTEFKETKIGKIPKEWEVKRIGQVIKKTEKIDPTKSDKGFQYVDISSIDNLTYRIINTTKINKDNAPSRARKVIRQGNIIYATTRPYLRNITLIPQSLDHQICSTGFCVMEPDENIISSYWLFYNVTTIRFNKRIEGKMKGATYPAVNDSDLYEELIPIPSVNEQNQITNILNDFSQKVDLEIQRKQKLERIKQGLMDDLLTGRKRVKL